MNLNFVMGVSLLCLGNLLVGAVSFADTRFIYERISSKTAEISVFSKDRSFQERVFVVRSEDEKCVDFEKNREPFQVCSRGDGFLVTGAGTQGSWNEIEQSRNSLIKWKTDEETREIVKKVEGDDVFFYEQDHLIAQAKHSEGNSELTVLTPVRENEVVRQALPNAFWFSLWSPLLLAETRVIEQHQSEAGPFPVEKTLVTKSGSTNGGAEGLVTAAVSIFGAVLGATVGSVGLLTASYLYRTMKGWVSPTPGWRSVSMRKETAKNLESFGPIRNPANIQSQVSSFFRRQLGYRTVRSIKDETSFFNCRVAKIALAEIRNGVFVEDEATISMSFTEGKVTLATRFSWSLRQHSVFIIKHSLPREVVASAIFAGLEDIKVLDPDNGYSFLPGSSNSSQPFCFI